LASVRVRIAVSSAAGFCLLVFMLWYTGFEQFLSSLRNVSPGWVILALTTVLISRIARSFRWKLLLSPVKNSVKYSNTLGVSLLGEFVNFLIPIRAGEFLRAFLMQKQEEVGFFEAFSSIVVEKILDLIAIVALATSALFLLPGKSEYPSWIVNSLMIVCLLISIMLGALILGMKREEKLLMLVKKTVSKIPLLSRWGNKLHDWLKEAIDGTKGISYKPTMTSVVVIQSLAVWALSAITFHLIFQAFTLNVSPIIILLGAMLFNLSYILPAPIFRIGSFEAFWSIVFVGLGLSLSEALPVAVMAHLTMAFFNVITGCLSMIWLGITFKELIKIR